MSNTLDFASRKSVDKPVPANFCSHEDISICTSLDRRSVMISVPAQQGMTTAFQMHFTDALRVASALIQAVAGPEEIEPRQAGG